jgi:hypothetical protein
MEFRTPKLAPSILFHVIKKQKMLNDKSRERVKVYKQRLLNEELSRTKESNNLLLTQKARRVLRRSNKNKPCVL